MKLEKYFSDPSLSKGSLKVWRRNFIFFRKTISVSLFWTVIEPLFYLGSIGFGLGSFVNNVNGYSYLDFFFPGLLCTTAMMIPYFECTYGNFAKLTWQKLYSTILLTPLDEDDVIGGELLWGTSKGFFGVFGVGIIASFFGLINNWRIIPAFIVLLMISWIFSCIGMIITSYAKSYDSFIYSTSGLIIPMSLFAGTYFPLQSIPEGIRYVVYLFPLTHGVELVREIILVGFSEKGITHFGVLLILCWVLMSFAKYRMKLKLQK